MGLNAEFWKHEYKELEKERDDLAQQLVTCRRTIKRMRKLISKPSDTETKEGIRVPRELSEEDVKAIYNQHWRDVIEHFTTETKEYT